MNRDWHETQERYDHNVRLGWELAERLAREAERMADTLDRLATVHEQLAAADHHPLKDVATQRALEERRIAESERRASRWLRALADDRLPAGRSPALPSEGQRLPSQ